MNREVLFYHSFEIGLREEYAIEYLETALETYREACGLRLETFTKGRGHKKTAEQKDYEQLQEYIGSTEKLFFERRSSE